MNSYFCDRYMYIYTYTDGDDKEVERDMYEAIPCFQDSHDRYGYELENYFEEFFSYS